MNTFRHVWKCNTLPGVYQSVEIDEQIIKQDNDIAKIMLLEVEKYFVERNPAEHKHVFILGVTEDDGVMLHTCKGGV